MLDRDTVISTIKSLLGREPQLEEALRYWMEKPSIEHVIREIASSPEYINRLVERMVPANGALSERGLSPAGNGHHISVTEYVTPSNLSRTPVEGKKVLLIGTCLMESWKAVLDRYFRHNRADHYLYNNVSSLPDWDADKVAEYDFQVINIPFRFVFSDDILFSTRFTDSDSVNDLLQTCRKRILVHVQETIKYNEQYGLETYYLNLIRPQFSFLGRLMPRYAANNLLYLVDKANEYLEEVILGYNNVYLFDIDNLASVFGRRFLLDDALSVTSHGGFLSDFDFALDQARMDPPVRASVQYDIRAWDFVHLVWRELFAAHRTVRQTDSVKMVITDLDNTLWRGVIGDDEVSPIDAEGWPLGYMEALSHLKQRGILLGILSKNTQEIVAERWARATNDRLSLGDFAAVRINWENKVDNMSALLRDVSLLPKNIVYIDDNPVERAAIAQAFPEMRVLGSNPYVLKRILLWSPETQVAVITAESRRRTEMIHMQSKRNESMQSMSREDFLRSLDIKVQLRRIRDEADTSYSRAFELLNKTNQFNTSGVPWSAAEMRRLFEDGGYLVGFEVEDIYTHYGLVGLLIVQGNVIRQFVMSCRVIGLEIETAVVTEIAGGLQREGAASVMASFIETDSNIMCRDVYANAGFVPAEGGWMLNGPTKAADAHLRLEWMPAILIPSV